MIKNYATALLAVLLSITTSAQEIKNKTDISEIRKNNFQVELGFNSIQNIYNNTASASIVLKKKYNPGKLIDVSSVKFLRSYFTINSKFNLSKDTLAKLLYFIDNKNHVDIAVGIGIEKQFQNRKFVHYYGCDINAKFYNGGQARTYYYNSSVLYNLLYQNEKTISPGVLPFIGLKYYVTDQLHFGIETGILLSYFHSTYSNIAYEYEVRNNQVLLKENCFEPVVENGIKFNFLGVRNITIGYSFK